jgi:hypothetical protein
MGCDGVSVYLHSINPKQVSTFGYRTSQKELTAFKWLKYSPVVVSCEHDNKSSFQGQPYTTELNAT